MDTLKYCFAGAGLLALLSCGRSGPVGSEIEELRETVDSSNAVLQELDSAEFMEAFNRLERHIEIAKTKEYDERLEGIFFNDFEWLRGSHRALFKFETLRRGEQWDGQLLLSQKQLKALHHDWNSRVMPDDSVRIALEEEKNSILPLLATMHTRLDEVRYVLKQNDSLDLHFQKLWDGWDSVIK